MLTEDIDDKGKVRPFPLDWPFLHDMIGKLENALADGEANPVLRYEKSRRLIVTTALCVWLDWHMLKAFTDPKHAALWFDDIEPYLGLFSASVTIKNEPDAKKVITRIRKIHERMPAFLRRPYSADNALNLEVEGGGQVWGLNAGGHAARLEGYTVSIMDECAFQPNAAENYRALRRCSRIVVIVSTANGKGNFFWDIGYDKDKSRGITQTTIRYDQHPERKPTHHVGEYHPHSHQLAPGGTVTGQKWYERETKGTPISDWLREQEIEYDVYAEPGLLSVDWRAANGDVACVATVEWDGKSVIDVTHDPGYWRSAVVTSYVNKHRQRCFMRVYLGKECTWDKMLTATYTDIDARYPGAAYRLCGDPAAHQNKSIANEHGENKDVEVCLRIAKVILGRNRVDYDYHCNKLPKHSRTEGHRMFRRLFYARADERPGILIDSEHCGLLLESVRGGYRFPDKPTELQKVNEEPNRTSDHVHVMDACRYVVVQFTERGSLPVYEEDEPEVDWAEINDTVADMQARRLERGLL